MNPVPVMPLVELIKAVQTSEEVCWHSEHDSLGCLSSALGLVQFDSSMHMVVVVLQTFLRAKELAEHLGKAVCVSEDRPGKFQQFFMLWLLLNLVPSQQGGMCAGFIINRCLMLMLNEAFYCLMEVWTTCSVLAWDAILVLGRVVKPELAVYLTTVSSDYSSIYMAGSGYCRRH